MISESISYGSVFLYKLIMFSSLEGDPPDQSAGHTIFGPLLIFFMVSDHYKFSIKIDAVYGA